jgi:hypothetical protein
MPLSLNPATFVKGGLINDVDVRILSARFASYDYQGRLTGADQLVCALKLEYAPLDNLEDVHTDYLSFGKIADFQPTEDGKGVESVSGKMPNQDTVFHLFMQSMQEAGFSMAELDKGDISVLDGLEVHIVRRPAPERWKALATGRRSEGEPVREKTYLAVSKVLGRAKPQAKPGAKPAAKTVPPAADIESKAADAVLAVMSEIGGGIKIKALQMKLLKTFTAEDPAVRKAILEKVADTEFLAGIGLSVSGDTVSVGEDVPF